MWGNFSWPLPFGHGFLPASAPDLGRGMVPLGRAYGTGRSRLRLARRWQLPALSTPAKLLVLYSNFLLAIYFTHRNILNLYFCV